jgi:hypothetical protein
MPPSQAVWDKRIIVCIFLHFFVTMKKFLPLLPLTFVLYACPFESTVPLASQPSEAVDSSLLGYWYGIVKDGSDYFGVEALEISKQSDSLYAITRYGKAIKGDIILPDTAYFTGYISHIGDQRFMNVEGSVVITSIKGKKTEVEVQKVYYLSFISRKNDTLTVKTITEKFSPTRKIFNSPEKLSQEVTGLVQQNKNIYDDQYSMQYRKIEKPRPLKGF